MLKRIGLFLATNLAIMLVLSVVVNLFGLTAYTQEAGLNLPGLLAICAVMGATGSFISLALSKWMAKRSTGARVITAPNTEAERWLVSTVEDLAQRAGIGMPEVAVYDAPDANAFATGMNRNKALVAVSTGLLQSMDRNEVRAVLAHEVSHVANGDMVTLALIQGVVNTFVMFVARVVGHTIDKVVLGNRDGPGLAYMGIVLALDLVLGVLASTIVFWFSRHREFRADAGAARLTSPQAMIGALERLRASRPVDPADSPAKEMSVYAINGVAKHGLKRLFMTHPPLEERIRALSAASTVA